MVPTTLALTLVLPVALAIRRHSVDMDDLMLGEQSGDEATVGFTGKSGSICGGAGIWQLLTQSATGDTFEDARNIQWETIESMKDAHLKDKEAKVALLEERLAKLKEQLQTALKAESLPSTSDSEHTQLVKSAVEPSGWNDVDTAHALKCGKERKLNGKRVPKEMRNAWETSLEIFKGEAKKFFALKTHRLDGMAFLATCNELLTREASPDPHHYCAQLCQEYKDAALSQSSSSLGAVAVVSNKLKNEIEEVQEELARTKASIAECNVDWEALDDFKGFITGLKGTYQERHGIWRKATNSLNDIEETLLDLEDDLEETEEKLKDATGKADAAATRSSVAHQALNEAQKKNQELKEVIKQTDEELQEVTTTLGESADAMNLMDRLKEKVSASMMLMMQLADAGLREPLANLGFSEDPADLEFAPADSTEDAPVLKEAVETLKEFCSSTAMPAFALVKEKLGDLDLSPLCNFKDAPAVYQDLVAQVDEKMAKIKEDMLEVVSWMNPWKAHEDMSMKEAEAMEDKLVAEGQLACLEQVKGIYTEPANEWFKYLIDWRKDGPHHKLIANLGKAVAELQQKQVTVNASLEKALKALEESKSASQQAEKELSEAEADESATVAEREALKEAREALSSQLEKTQQAVDEWTDKVAQAKKNLDAAKEALTSAYTEFTVA